MMKFPSPAPHPMKRNLPEWLFTFRPHLSCHVTCNEAVTNPVTAKRIGDMAI